MRTRLTLWFVAGVLLFNAIGVVIIYQLVGVQLIHNLEEDLAGEIVRFQEVARGADSRDDLVAATREYLASEESEPMSLHGMAFAVLVDDGRVVSNLADVHLEDIPQGRMPMGDGQPVLDTFLLDGEEFLVASVPLVPSDDVGAAPVGVLEIASPLGPVRSSQRDVLVVLVLVTVVGTTIIGMGSWLLVGKALEPVRTITRTASGISRRDLGGRIVYEGPKDEIGELAETMNAMLGRLEASFAAQDRFIGDVSHELRTPLTIAKGHLQVLDLEHDDPEVVRASRDLVLEELDRLNRLVADLLTLARANRSDFLQMDRVDLDALLRNLTRQGRHLAERRWTVDELPGCTLNADQDRLTQVFLNLMHNAVRYTSSGTVVALGGRCEPDRVLMWVRDEGRGMEPDVRERVFDRFYRGAGPASGGLGLGLAIAAGIVAAHGGHIDVRSAPGEGSVFEMAFPLDGVV